VKVVVVVDGVVRVVRDGKNWPKTTVVGVEERKEEVARRNYEHRPQDLDFG
jgi:hypothetical protein